MLHNVADDVIMVAKLPVMVPVMNQDSPNDE